jgi:hypothetical protein
MAYDITEGIPYTIPGAAVTGGPGGVSGGAVVPGYTGTGVLYDCTINGLPFFYAITDEQPYVRETNEYKRQQLDTSNEPGEQTLSQWWVRDEDSFHRGAGILYYEPGSDDTAKYRYASSDSVDVWTKGEAKLHKSCTLLDPTSGDCYVVGARVSNADVLFGVIDGAMWRYNGSTTTTYTGAPWAPTTEPAIAGAKVLVGGTGGIMVGDANGSTLASLYTDAGFVKPWWVKSRIIAAKGNKLYEATIAGGGVALSTLTPICEHPDTGWTWTGVAETPDAILASGYSNGNGAIFAFNLQTDGLAGGVPTLDNAVQVAEFPPGEEVHSIRVYLGAYIAMGTSGGVRIGAVGQNGRIQYGPLTLETTSPVRALSARGSYVYASVDNDIDGVSGCARIDLSEEIVRLTSSGSASAQSFRYAYAYDAKASQAGTVRSVTLFGQTDRVALAISGKGIYVQAADVYETTGTLTTGRIRYATSEPKTFYLAKVRARLPVATSVKLSVIDADGVETDIITLDSDFDQDEDVTLGAVREVPQKYISLKLTLYGDGTDTPVVDSFQVKATPNPRIQRNVRLPLRLMDVEEDRNGNKIGYEGAAWLRLQALENMEQDHSVIAFSDATNGETFNGQIKSIQFLRDTPPSRNLTNFGGIAIVTLLKL